MDITIKDVAKAAGVSKATVSRYFNDIDRVNKETAERIRNVIEELRYIPNATARNLALKKTDKLGVLVSGITSPFWNQILGAIHSYISQMSDPYEIFTLNVDSTVLNNSNKSIQDKINVLLEQRVAGIMLVLRDLQQKDVNYLCEQDIPFVVVQNSCSDERISYVNIDNYTAGFEAAQYLIQIGHKDIAYVGGPSDTIYTNERFEGFRDALIAKRLFRRAHILNGDNSYADGYWRAKQILSWNPLPTAIMFASDYMAYGAISAIQETGLSVPDDISVMGFDGMYEEIEIFRMLPPLTTTYQPMNQIGEKTAEILLKKIRDKASGKNKTYRVMLPTRLIDRGSCRDITGL